MNKITTLLISTSLVLTLSACNAGNVSSESGADNSSASVPDTTGVVHISNAQLQTLLDQNVTLIDIRRPEEWAHTGVVPGSKKLTFFSKTGAINPQLVPELQRMAAADQPVVLICRTGSRTRAAAQMINSQLGYNTVYNVQDGITKWIADGRAVIK